MGAIGRLRARATFHTLNFAPARCTIVSMGVSWGNARDPVDREQLHDHRICVASSINRDRS